MKLITVNMFWAKGSIGKLEQLSLNSFLYQGYHVRLWSYDKSLNIPQGVELVDAANILSEDLIFYNKQGSIASFSDLFRYKLLDEQGGLYVDTDVIALKPASQLPKYPFIVTERVQYGYLKKILGKRFSYMITNNILYNPNPNKGDLINLAYVFSNAFQKDCVYFSELGPKLLTAIHKIYPHHGYKIMSPVFANDINYWDCPNKLLKNKFLKISKDSHFLHCYNERWRISNYNKELDFPANSILHKIEKNILNK